MIDPSKMNALVGVEGSTAVDPAIFLKQFRLFVKGKQPIAFLTWAKVSSEVKAALEAGRRVELDLKGWRSGPHLVVVDCISPFGPAEKIKEEFLKSMGVGA
ncbi:MAG: toxin-activating lysine-acyltransferase [Paracoccaceae bacterium]